MRRKSKESPGSVLAILTEHVRQQMEQDAMSEILDKSHRVTSGVKVTTYFNMHVRPSYQSHVKEMREMYMLSVTIDLLRKGDLPKVGDSLAARFMAIHQSLVDQNWLTARHMELFPLEETTAASSAMVLASRKHGRLWDKVQGKGWPSWGGKGKGGGSRQDWNAWPEAPQKGKRGRGNKGKGKGKEKGSGGDRANQDWEKNKDKPEAGK